MFTIAIDLGGTIIKAGLLDGRHLAVSCTEDAKPGKGLKDNLPVIEEMIERMLKKRNVPVNEILGIGFSFPGLVNSVQNRVLATNKKYDDATGLDLAKWSKDTWGLPLCLENDARAALLGEWQHGAGQGYENIVMVTLGTGIGSAVLIEGRLLKGKHFQAGNLGGHFTVNHSGMICTCGNIGCMESEVSTWRMPELIRSNPLYLSSSLRKEKLLDFKSLFLHASNNDMLAREILEHSFSVWSSGLVNMIHAFDPEVIILSGGIMKSAGLILPELQDRVNKRAWTPWGKVLLLKARHTDSAALFGADYLVRKSQA
jgi:glucokinase